MTTAIKAKLCLTVTAAALACAACSGPGNTGMNPPDDKLVAEIPWLNAGIPHFDTTQPPDVPNTKVYPLIEAPFPVYPAIGLRVSDGTVDPPPTAPAAAWDPAQCAAVAPYEFAPWIETAEPRDAAKAMGGGGTVSDLVGIAIRWAGADDMTRGSWRTPGFTTWYPGLENGTGPTGDSLLNSLWGTPAQALTDIGNTTDGTKPYSDPYPGAYKDATGKLYPGLAPQCDVDAAGNPLPNQYVIHMRGSGFRYYGGNIAHILAGDNFVTDATQYNEQDCPKKADGSPSDLCHLASPDGKFDTAGFPLKPTENPTGTGDAYELGALHTYWDASKYTGVSFWARRGPDSMGTLQVTVADKYNSDDMNRQNEKYCRRILQCHTASHCPNYQGCNPSIIADDLTQDKQPVMRCFDPNKGMAKPPPGSGTNDDQLDAIYPRCGDTCTFRTTYPDADLEGKQCLPYTFTSGESAEYCSTPEQPPPSREERCGDGFQSDVQLTDQWVFYTLPFADMRQAGFGKIAPEFDLTSVYSITLQWGAGNMDIYLDNVSLYRLKKLP